MTAIVLPQANANDTGARLVEWLVAPGTEVRAGQPIAAFETTKVAFEVEAPAAGWLVSTLLPGDFVEIGETIGSIAAAPPPAPARAAASGVQITVKARALMEKHGISADRLPQGVPLIREKDVLALVTGGAAPPAVPDQELDAVLGSEEFRDLKRLLDALRDRMKKKFARHVPTGTLLGDRWELARAWGFGEKASVYDDCFIFGDVRVGENCWIGPYTVLDGSGGTLEIGDWTSIGAGAHLYTHHTIDLTLTGGAAQPFRAPTKLGKCSFVAPMAMVAPGTVIGDHCFIAAHSYVEGHFPSYSYIAGNPARVVGKVEIKGGRVVKTTF